MEHPSPIERASDIVGSLSALAKAVGVRPPTAHEWKTGERPIPIKRCLLICEVTKGEVTLQELRPNDFHLIWPELAQAQANQGHGAIQTAAQGV